MTAAEGGCAVGHALQTCAAWFQGGSADPVILDLHGMRLAVAVHRHGDTSCSGLFDRVVSASAVRKYTLASTTQGSRSGMAAETVTGSAESRAKALTAAQSPRLERMSG
jgi:hypothetical protein